MEQILCKKDRRKIVMATKCKQLSNFKALWCFIHKIIQHDEISFVLLEILVQLSRNTFHIFHAHFHKLLKQILLILILIQMLILVMSIGSR